MRIIVTTDPGPAAPGSAGRSAEYATAKAAVLALCADLTDGEINDLVLRGLRDVQKARQGVAPPAGPVGSKAIPVGSRVS